MFPQQPDLTRCPGCHAEIPTAQLRLHVCDWERWLDHQVALRRGDLERFEHELGAYLDSPRGRFDLWYAQRERLRSAAAPEAAA